MNYLAHLVLAQPTADSYFGNLLGDFGGHRKVKLLPNAVQNALDNHYLVDRFTDQHPLVKTAKQCFPLERKRFAGIAIDVLFDHFLIQHWQDFHQQPLIAFKHQCFMLLKQRLADMPPRMQQVVRKMICNDWFQEYETLTGIGLALDNIAKRIRFANNFAGAINDIYQHHDALEAAFLEFFPELLNHVQEHNIECARDIKLPAQD